MTRLVAHEAAGDKDIRIGGGASVIRQYLRESLIDELHVAISPILLGSGERLFEDVDLRDTRLRVRRVQGLRKSDTCDPAALRATIMAGC